MFSRANGALRIGRSDGRCSKQSDQNDSQVEAAVESILELGEVTLGVLGEIERMVGSRERRLQIAQVGIDRAKLLQLHAGSTAADDGALGVAPDYDGSEAPQSIGDDINRRAQRFLRPLGNRVFGKLKLGQTNEQKINDRLSLPPLSRLPKLVLLDTISNKNGIDSIG